MRLTFDSYWPLLFLLIVPYLWWVRTRIGSRSDAKAPATFHSHSIGHRTRADDSR